MKSSKGTCNPTGKKKVLQMKRKGEKEADGDEFVEIGKAMDALVTARSNLLRARAKLLDYKTPDAAHTLLDAANYFIDQAQNCTRQAFQMAISYWFGGKRREAGRIKRNATKRAAMAAKARLTVCKGPQQPLASFPGRDQQP